LVDDKERIRGLGFLGCVPAGARKGEAARRDDATEYWAGAD